MGNRTWINDGQLPTTVEQINFGLEPVNKNHKRYIVNKNISSGISNNPISLQETQLDSLTITSATSSNCAPSPPMWTLMTPVTGTECSPYPQYTDYKSAPRTFCINTGFSTPGAFKITVSYKRCGYKNLQKATSGPDAYQLPNGTTLSPSCSICP